MARERGEGGRPSLEEPPTLRMPAMFATFSAICLSWAAPAELRPGRCCSLAPWWSSAWFRLGMGRATKEDRLSPPPDLASPGDSFERLPASGQAGSLGPS